MMSFAGLHGISREKCIIDGMRDDDADDCSVQKKLSKIEKSRFYNLWL